MRRHLPLALVIAHALLAGAPALAIESDTPGIEVARVDVHKGVVAFRRARVVPAPGAESNPEAPGISIRELVVLTTATGVEDTLELCRGPEEEPACAPRPDALSKEAQRLDLVQGKSNAVAVARFDTARIGKKAAVKRQHAGRDIHIEGRTLGDVESGFAQAELWINVDGERRYRTDASWTLAMGGRPKVFASLYCAAEAPSRCLVVGGFHNMTGRGTGKGLAVTAPFALDGAKLDAAALRTACAKKPRVTIVANPGLVASEGERWAAALNAAGCHAGKPEKGQAARAASVVYARDPADPNAALLAGALGTKVEALTWASAAPWVVALGG